MKTERRWDSTKHSKTQKESFKHYVGAVGISCLLCSVCDYGCVGCEWNWTKKLNKQLKEQSSSFIVLRRLGGERGLVVGRCHWMDLSSQALNSTPPRFAYGQVICLLPVWIFRKFLYNICLFVNLIKGHNGNYWDTSNARYAKDGATRCILGRWTCRPKFTVFVCELDGKWFTQKLTSYIMNRKVKVLSIRFALTKFEDVAVLD